jgi:hypothetical protein
MKDIEISENNMSCYQHMKKYINNSRNKKFEEKLKENCAINSSTNNISYMDLMKLVRSPVIVTETVMDELLTKQIDYFVEKLLYEEVDDVDGKMLFVPSTLLRKPKGYKLHKYKILLHQRLVDFWKETQFRVKKFDKIFFPFYINDNFWYLIYFDMDERKMYLVFDQHYGEGKDYMSRTAYHKYDSYMANTAIIFLSLSNIGNHDINYKDFEILAISTPKNVKILSELTSGAITFMYICRILAMKEDESLLDKNFNFYDYLSGETLYFQKYLFYLAVENHNINDNYQPIKEKCFGNEDSSSSDEDENDDDLN